MATTASDAYPEARYDRNPPSSVSPVPTMARSLTPPRSRFFTVEMGASINSRGTCSTPKIIGPAVIQRVQIKYRTAADPPIFGFELGWATFPVTENSVPLTNSKPWNALVERLRHFYETPIPGLAGTVQVNAVGSDAVYQVGFPEPILVTAPEFYLTMTFINVSGATNPFACWVEAHVLENISPEVAANFH